MNKKLKIALKNRSSEQGFAIPIAVGMGLIMLLIASTMIVRSQGDQVTASAQKATAKSLSIAETGITRVQSFLNKNRGFANHPYPWTNYLANLANPCTSGRLYNEVAEFDNWITVGGNDQFRVISYTPTATEGVLVMEGQVRQGSNVTSSARLQVRIGLDRTRKPSFNPPGAWAEKFVLGNNRITGNVIDAGCPPGSITTSQRSQINGTVTYQSELTLPPALSVPPGAINISAITSDKTLPGATDTANAAGVYVYHVGSASGKSINLSGSNKLIIKPGQKVALYLDGNIDTSGGGVKIGHNCYDSSASPDGLPNDNDSNGTVGDSGDLVTGCVPTNFQIFGGTGTTEIVLAGNNTIDAFIFAPNAINSGVNGTAEIRGSVWVKEWDRSSANHNVITQTGDWNNIPLLLWPPRLSPLRSWQREAS